MLDPSKELDEELRAKLEARDMPEWTQPMLATLTDDHFSDPGWIFERKLDGERCLAFKDGDEVRLMSRNEKPLDGQYPELVEPFERQDQDSLIVDGELVAFEGNRTSFARLQDRMHLETDDPLGETGVRVYYYLFDILYLNGYDTTALPLRARKRLLRDAIDFDDPIRWTPHRDEEGEAYLEEACGKGWEGLIAKDATAPYVHSRSKKWLKFKCVHQQELVVGGFTDPGGSRKGFGALLLGYFEDGDFVYAGKVGTGFDDETLEWLRGKMDDIEVDEPPFDDGDPGEKGEHFVEPELVAEIGFTEWTSDGKLRHPRYLGLRDDKDAKDVVRERPE